MQRYSFLDLQAYASALYGGRPLLMVPYAYNVTFTALAQGATQPQSLSITANADFILTGLKYRAQIGAAQTVSNKTAAFVRVLIVDSGSNEQFTNAAIDLENYSTNGGDSRDLPYPRFIQGRTALSFQATNYAPTAETYTTLDLMLEGVLVRALSQ
ncbi:MAG: hypothetical protein ACOYBQ_10295 [Fluviibacter sp.]